MKQQQTERKHRITHLARAAGRLFIPNLGTLLLVGLFLWVQQAGALPQPQATAPNALPATITYQGKLTDATGTPVTGEVDMTFSLYDVLTVTTSLWSEAYTGENAIPVQEGEFTVHLGSINPISNTVWQNSPLYLGIRVGNDPEMTPRESLAAVPWAMTAGQALNVAVGSGSLSNGEQIPLPTYPDGTQASIEQCEWLVSPKYFAYSDSNCSDNHGIRKETISVDASGKVTGWRGVMVWNNCDIAKKNISDFYYLIVCTR